MMNNAQSFNFEQKAKNDEGRTEFQLTKQIKKYIGNRMKRKMPSIAVKNELNKTSNLPNK